MDSQSIELDNILADVSAMQGGIHCDSKAIVSRWTTRDCIDGQMPLVGVISFLTNAVPPIKRDAIHNRGELFPIMLDIVNHSSLSLILVCIDGSRIQYRVGVSSEIKQKIASFIESLSTGIAN